MSLGGRTRCKNVPRYILFNVCSKIIAEIIWLKNGNKNGIIMENIKRRGRGLHDGIRDEKAEKGIGLYE